MSTYRMTPADRRVRAEQLRRARAARVNPYRIQTTETAQRESRQAVEEDVGTLEKIGATAADVGVQLTGGIVKGLEGIVDAGASLVGAIGGIFSDDFQEDVQDMIEYDFTGETILNPAYEAGTKHSYLYDSKAGQIAQSVIGGVGGMLPAVAVAFIPGVGTSLATKLATATLMTSAAGNSMEEAYADGAEYGAGMAYGAAAGAVEGLTEKLTGGFTKNIIGKGFLDDVIEAGTKGVAKTGAKRVALNMAEEAAEEALATAANPALKSIYKGADAFNVPNYWGGVAESAVVGGLTAAAYGGTVGRLTHNAGRDADIRDSKAAIGTVRQKLTNLWANDKMSDENDAQLRVAMEGNLKNIETALQKANPKQRAKLIEQHALSELVDENGKLRDGIVEDLLFMPRANADSAPPKTSPLDKDATAVYNRKREERYGVSESIEDTSENSEKMQYHGDREETVSYSRKLPNDASVTTPPQSTALDRRYVSPEMWNKADEIRKELEIINEALREKNGFESQSEVESLDHDATVQYHKKDKDYKKYPKKQSRLDYYTDIMIWARSSARSIGDTRIFYDGRTNTYNKVVVDDSEEGYGVYDSIEYISENEQAIKRLRIEIRNDNYRAELGIDESVHENIGFFESLRRSMRHDNSSTQIGESNGRARSVDENATSGESDGEHFGRQSLGDTQNEVKHSLKTADTDVDAAYSDITVFRGELSEKAREAYKQLKKAFVKLSSKTKTGMGFVLLKENPYFNGVILKSGNTVYITADTLENGTWAGKLVHEVTHFAEGTKEYRTLMDFVLKDQSLSENVMQKLLGTDVTKIQDITNGTAGQTLIKAAGSVYDVSTNSIPEPEQNVKGNIEKKELVGESPNASAENVSYSQKSVSKKVLTIQGDTKDKRTAHQSSTGVSRPVGNAIKSSSSANSIPDFGENVKGNAEKSSSGYGFTQELLETAMEKYSHGEELTAEEERAISELGAHMTEELLGNEWFIERLVRDESRLAEKILGKIHDLMDAFSRLTDKNARAEYNRLKRAEKLYMDAVENARLHYTDGRILKALPKDEEDERETAQEDAAHEVAYAIKYPSFSEKDIADNMETLADMESVATIDASKLEKTGKAPLDIYKDFFDLLGNSISTKSFGDIALSKASARSEIRHGNTAEKIASIEAIPAVLEKGKVIFHQEKEAGVERIVTCAPIRIGNADYYMGVMLQRDSRYQRLYLHNVVNVEIKREMHSQSKDNLVTTGTFKGEDHLSITSIIQKAVNVKLNKKKTSGNVSYSLKPHSVNQRIAEGMSDAERAAILQKQTIKPHEVEIAAGFDLDFEQLEKNRKSMLEKPLIKKIRELGILKQYETDIVDVAFEFTTGGLRKSMNSQVSDYGGNLGDLAKVVMNMQPLLDRAVLLEIHRDKAKGTLRENPQLLQTHVLLSAYRENGFITPVQFEIKQYVDDQNRLYLAVALTKTEAGVLSDTMLDKNQTSTRLIPASGEAGVLSDTAPRNGERTRLIPASDEKGVMGDTILDNNQASTRLIPVSNISISQLIQKINPKDENFFKYIPNAMLDKDQLAAKRRALEKEAKKYGRDSGVQYALKEHTPSDEERARSAKVDSANQRITLGMSDAERYEVLKDQSVAVSAKVDSRRLSAVQARLKISEENIELSKYGERVRLFKKMGEEFSAFRRYYNDDIKLEFSFSKGNMRESVSKQRHNYLQLAKLLTCLNDVIDNAVGIEVHNRNAENYKVDPSLVQVYVLAGAFWDGNHIVPVKLEVKEFSDKKNTLHIAIAWESIKQDGIVKQEVAKEGVARQDSPPSDISIADFFRKINPNDESFYKYIPKQFLEKRDASTASYTLKPRTPTDVGQGDSGASRYSYEALTKKGNISVVELSSEIPLREDGRIDNKEVVARGKRNAKKQNNPRNTETDVYVRVDDIGQDVLLGTKGLQHGLVRSEETARAVMKIGDVLKGSVAVNELEGSASRKTDMSYVLLGACRDDECLYVVRSVVSKLRNDVTEIDIYRLGAVKGKKTETPNPALKRGAAVTEQSSLISSESHTISIAELFEKVKNLSLANEIFSKDVSERLGVSRSVGTLSDRVRYSMKNGTPKRKSHASGDFVYTKEQYEHFGWVRANEILNAGQAKDFFSKFANAVTGLAKFPKTKSGEYMIAVSDIYDPYMKGVDNTIVYAKGKIESPEITRVVDINEYDGAILAERMEEVYEAERKGIRRKTEGVFICYDAVDFLFSWNRQRNASQDGRYHDELGVRRGGSDEKTGRIEARHFDEEGNEISREVRSFLKSHTAAEVERARNLELDRYTEEQYNHFGWARYAEALSKNELDDMYSKIHEKGSLTRFPRSADGEAIIEVNDAPYTTLGIDNVFVFVKGTKYRPQIEHVVRVNIFNETELGEYRDVIYKFYKKFSYARASSACAHYCEQDGLFLDYSRTDVENYRSYEANVRERSEAFGKTKGDVSYSLKPGASVGQNVKSDANENRQKVYTREDARKIVNGVLASSKHFEENHGALVGKNRAEVIEALWKGLNAAEPGKQMGVALDVADSIIRAASLEERLSPVERKGLRQEIARKILQGFVDYGSPSKLSRVVNESAERMNKMRETVQKTKQEAEEREARAVLAAQVIRLKKAVKDRHYRAHEFNDPTFRGSIERMFNYATRNNILSSDVVRRNLGELSKWYTEKNPLLQNGFSAEGGGVENTLFVPFVKTWLDEIASGEGALTVQECKTVKKIFSYFQKLVEEYHLVNVNGEMKDADEMARGFVEKIDEAGDRTNGPTSTYFKTHYGRESSDPRSVMLFGDQYIEGGFFTETFDSFTYGGIDAAWEELDIGRAREAFLKEHKSYQKRLQEHTVEYQGKRIPLENAMDLYMTGKDADSHAHLVKGGFGIDVERKVAKKLAWTDDAHSDRVQYRFDPLEPNLSATTDRDSMKHLVKEQNKALEAQFSKEDLAYIKILEDMMVRATAIKRATDYKRFGTTNVKEGYYMTLVTAEVAKTIDNMSFLEYTDRVTNFSFNKSRVQGAASMLVIGRATDVVLHHVKQVALYAHLAVPTDTFNKLYNRNVNQSNPNRPITIKSRLQSTKTGRDLCDYLFKMKRDIEGEVRIEAADRWWNRMIGKVRKNTVVFQLGLNIKVRFSQASSLLAATNILDYDCIIKAFGVKNKGNEIDKYCHLAEVRNHENAAALARGVVDKLSKIGDKLLADIGWIDRRMNVLLFGACQVQIEKNGGARIGTEENKRAAGELLTRVILETQQNSLASERTGWMRSDGEIRRAVSMYSADAVKSQARVLDAVGEISAIKRRLKRDDLSAEERRVLKLALKNARKKLRRALAAHLSTALYIAMIALGVNSLFARNDDKEEEEILKNTAGDFVGNMLGGLPVVRDVYSMLADGYEADHFLYSTFNDVMEGAKSLMDIGGDMIGGKDVSKQEILGNVKKATYATGQLLGFPVRNAYNLFTGVSNRFFPQFGYTVESQFTVQSYSADLNAAIEAGDDRMVATIAGLMIDEDLGALSRETREVIRPLVEAGYSVMPRALGDSVTFEGETIALTRAQKQRFEQIYSVADTVVEDLVKLQAFRDATQEEQAKAIKFVWDTYHQLALDDLLGEDTEERTVLFAEAIPVEKLALIVATVRSMTADTDRRGNVIVGSRKNKVIAYISSLNLTAVQKYMLAGWAGYKNIHGEAQVRAYINTLNLSKAEKAALLKYSGYNAA